MRPVLMAAIRFNSCGRRYRLHSFLRQVSTVAKPVGNHTILEFLRPGDTLVVVKLDRLGRSTRDVLNLVHELEQRGAHLRELEPAIATDGPMGKMVLTVLGMVTEMELGFIRDRQRAGIEAAKLRGVYKGRPVTLDHVKIVAMRAEGKGATEIARAVGCRRGAVYKALHRQQDGGLQPYTVIPGYA